MLDVDFENIRRVAYGELFWKPCDLAEYSFYDVILAIEGLRNKDYWHELLIRKLARTVAYAGNNRTMAKQFDNKFWPDSRKSVKKGIPQAALDQLRRFRVAEEAKKLKDAGRIEDSN